MREMRDGGHLRHLPPSQTTVTSHNAASPTNWSLSSGLDAIVANKMKDNGRDSKDFLLLILRAREPDIVSSTVFTAIRLAAYELLLGGCSTTSSSIIYLVAGNPEVEKKLLEEIDGFGPLDQIPTANYLQLKFPYLDQARLKSLGIYSHPDF
ncbi:hypothetical protein Acr_20g0003220 [Actinidia rufa]|uniref:Uncharacterized protein n=1 Tax=Actinidia rufa TaxID=165716 RepID=A0A7J0GCK3_9ERIC|nr:hypothetical protein Acr_20g0003220 [Actinidia rufa]